MTPDEHDAIRKIRDTILEGLTLTTIDNVVRAARCDGMTPPRRASQAEAEILFAAVSRSNGHRVREST